MILKELCPQQESLRITQVMLSRHHNLLESSHLLPLNLLLQDLVETIDLVNNLPLLNKLNEIGLQLVNTHMELLSYLMQRYDTVSLHMLLKSFQSDVPENRHILMVPKVWVKTELVLYCFQVPLELKVVAVQETLDDGCRV